MVSNRRLEEGGKSKMEEGKDSIHCPYSFYGPFYPFFSVNCPSFSFLFIIPSVLTPKRKHPNEEEDIHYTFPSRGMLFFSFSASVLPLNKVPLLFFVCFFVANIGNME